ncbi:MAG: YifB family Mg chelatase-like AAA ATPase [Deltaproteobacteria bacterium]|jgi:magnesium chelatase family protein|nr:YifB family Mg chelatase-like AAA ATPase [Deltaproteobacteria bacterium]
MASKTYSTTLLGIDAVRVDVEAQIGSGATRFVIVGLPDGILKESKDRIRCAIKNSGFSFPYGEVIVSLSPASLPKTGANFELAIALSILAASDQIPTNSLLNKIFLGEFALDGTIRSVPGIIASASFVKKLEPDKELIIPYTNLAQAKLISGIKIQGAISLQEVAFYLRGELPALDSGQDDFKPKVVYKSPWTFADVVGQHAAKRALEISAAGEHNLLMVGPPGTGKSMLAQRIVSILPPLKLQEIIELTKIYSVQKTGELLSTTTSYNFGVVTERPFRSPHYTVSYAGLVGGGTVPTPGEITLAHKGVLFLDELTEFKRNVLETLRTPLETRQITISRANHRISYPADFIMLAAMNPCPCGKKGLIGGDCRCTPLMIERYLSKISGPFLDRIDLQIWVSPVNFLDLNKPLERDPTPQMLERVLKAREIQRLRFKDLRRMNKSMTSSELKKYCVLNAACEKLLESANKQLNLSARSYTRILKLARTIADLAEAANISEAHLNEAIGYRLRSIGF